MVPYLFGTREDNFVEDNFPLDGEAERGVDGFISPAIHLLLGSLDPNRYQFMSQGWGPPGLEEAGCPLSVSTAQ